MYLFDFFFKRGKLWRYVLQADKNSKIMKMIFASSKNIDLFFTRLEKLKNMVLEAKKSQKT